MNDGDGIVPRDARNRGNSISKLEPAAGAAFRLASDDAPVDSVEAGAPPDTGLPGATTQAASAPTSPTIRSVRGIAMPVRRS